MISVQGLHKNYGSFKAVDGISFEIGRGEVVAFLGPNGAGKTTTLRILASYLPPTEGKVEIAGLDVVEHPLEVRRLLGYLPENNPIYEEMEVTEYLAWGADLRGLRGPEKTQAVRRALERCGLGPVVGRDIGLLSKGYRQRVGLAQAILHDPPILFLDEPTSGLDPNQAREVRALLGELKAKKTVFVSTHILPEAEALADRVLIIHKGRVAAQGSPADLASRGRKLIVTLRAGEAAPQAVLAALSAAAGGEAAWSAVDGEDRYVVPLAAQADPREAVFRAAAREGWPLLELRREGASLEQVFHDLTLG